MNLRPPPDTDNINDYKEWCQDLYRFLQYPAFHAIRFVPRASKANRQEGDVYYDSDTDKLTLGVAAAWEEITSA